MSSRELQPGEWDAVRQGCTCMQRDGEPQQSERWPEWLVEGCPLHDPNYEDPRDMADRWL